MATLIDRLDEAIDKKIEDEWCCSHYGEINPEWAARRKEEYVKRAIAILLGD